MSIEQPSLDEHHITERELGGQVILETRRKVRIYSGENIVSVKMMPWPSQKPNRNAMQ